MAEMCKSKDKGKGKGNYLSAHHEDTVGHGGIDILNLNPRSIEPKPSPIGHCGPEERTPPFRIN
jgi:hypothetical protein